MYSPNVMPVELDEAFSPEFIPAVRAYIESMQRAINECDLVVLVARKAVCLYYALRANGELEAGNSSAKIASSRVLDYPGVRALPHSRVSVYDDIMVHGGSASQTMARVQKLGWSAEINVIGLCNEELGADVRQYSLRYAEDLALADVYRLAREIVRYVQASGISNNIDQPLYHIEESGRLFRRVFEQEIWFDLTTPVQHEYRIANISAVFGESLRPKLKKGSYDPLSMLLRRSINKVRLFYSGENSSMAVIPFVLPPEMSESKIERLFSLLIADDERLIFSSGEQAEDVRKVNVNNRLRVIRYVVSKLFAEALLSDEQIRDYLGEADVRYDESVEEMLFGAPIGHLINHTECWMLDGNVEAERVPPHLSSYLESAVKLAQTFLLKVERKKEVWPFEGRLDDDGCRDAAIGLPDLVNRIHLILGGGTDPSLALSDEECTILASAALDALIDEGRFIPSARVKSESGVLKACRFYRGGEIFTPTRKKLLLTAVALDKFAAGLKDMKPPKQVFDGTANLIAALFMRWNDPEIGAAANKTGAFADELVWSSNAGALCGSDGTSLVDILRDLSLLTVQYEAPSSAGDALSTAERMRAADFASDMVSLFSYTRAGGKKNQTVQSVCGNRNAMTYVLEKMLYTRANGFKVFYAHAAFSRIARRLEMNVGSPDWASIIRDIDESMFVEESEDALADFMQYAIDAGIRGSLFLEYSTGKGGGAPPHASLLLALCRQTFETLSTWAVGSATVVPDEKDRCVDTIEMLVAILSEVCRSGGNDALREVQGIVYDDGMQAVSIPTDSLSERLESKGADKAIPASRMLNKAFHKDARIVCFVDSALHVMAVSHLASMENDRLDTSNVYPRRLIAGLEEWAKDNAVPLPRCASLILCAATADVGEETAKKIIKTAGLVYRGAVQVGDNGQNVVQSLNGYQVAAYYMEEEMPTQGSTTNNFYDQVKVEVNDGGAASVTGTAVTHNNEPASLVGASNIEEYAREVEKQIERMLEEIRSERVKLDETLVDQLEEARRDIVERAGKQDKPFLTKALGTLTTINGLFDDGTPIGKFAQLAISSMRPCIGMLLSNVQG